MLPGLIGFALVGLSLGLLGGGGSILAVPVLVYAMGVPAGIAVPMSLPVVGIAAAVGAWGRWRRGLLRLEVVMWFGITAMITAFTAARLGSDIPDRPRLLLFVTVMLLAAAVMWYRSVRPAAEPTSPVERRPTRPFAIVPAAAAVGTLTGLVGVGGGFLMVPAMVGFLAMPMAEATATSLAIIALNTLAAGAGWWGEVELDWTLTAMVTAAALAGMALGTRLAPRFSSRSLSRIFAVLLVLVGTFMVYEQLK